MASKVKGSVASFESIWHIPWLESVPPLPHTDWRFWSGKKYHNNNNNNTNNYSYSSLLDTDDPSGMQKLAGLVVLIGGTEATAPKRWIFIDKRRKWKVVSLLSPDYWLASVNTPKTFKFVGMISTSKIEARIQPCAPFKTLTGTLVVI